MTFKSAAVICCPAFFRPALDRIRSSPMGYRLARGTFWSLAGSIISRSLMFIAMVVVARMLGRTGYGELEMIQSTASMLGIFAGFGLGLTATKHIAEFRGNDPERAGRILGLSGLVAAVTGGLIAAVLFVFAPWLARHVINAPRLDNMLRISSLILFINALNGAQTGALAGFEAFRSIACVNLLVGLLSFPILIGGAYWGGLTGVVWALTINLGINWLLNHRALRKEAFKYNISFTLKRCGREMPVLWKFSLPAVLGVAMASPVTWACNALLVNQSRGYDEMGVYGAVLRVKQMPEMLIGMLMAPFLPMLSEYFSKSDTQSYSRMVSYSFVLSLCVVVPVSLIQIAVPSLTLLPYGEGYGGYTDLVQWLMFHSLLVGLFWPFGSILASMGRMWFGFIYNLSWGMLLLVSACLFIPRYGSLGLGAALALTHLVTSLFCVGYIYYHERAFIADIPLVSLIVVVLFMLGICVAASRLLPPLAAGGTGCLAASVVIAISARLIKQQARA